MSDDYGSESIAESGTEEHEHSKECFGHDEHWQDDFAFVSEHRLPVPEDAPTLKTVAQVINQAAKDGGNVPVYRFAVIYVEAESGRIEVMTNPGMSRPAAMNLLTRATSLMAYQDAREEQEAVQMVSGLGHFRPGTVLDLKSLFSEGLSTADEVTEDESSDDRSRMKGGYL